ncbi:DUF1801 domain-containing protein [Pedobacter sp. Leaf250]|uniref:DUF1801 domain-containing protein n=1 Tax=Pedobacter sp. Leaf250 TaxID=2876559 RepID=UPI001E417BA0|nr:DUF1801 domain-containing protein [Pedobacter sp. Leaf250]
MAQNKTTENDSNVNDFLDTIENEVKKRDSISLCNIMSKTTGFEAKMWGTAIIGFGSYHYQYESGREGDAPLVGFSPRKDAVSLYFATDFKDKEELLLKFGKHKTGKACVYVKKLDDIDLDILKVIIKNSIESIQNQYPK